MSILFATVAKDVQLKFVAGPSVEDVQVFGFPFHQNKSHIDVNQEDFYAGEKRSVLLRLALSPQTDGKIRIGTLGISYVDVLEKDRRVSITKPITVYATKDKTRVAKEVNKKVTVEATLIEADQRHEDFIRLYEKGDKQRALQNIERLEAEMKKKNESLANTQISKKIEALQMETEEMKNAEKSRQHRSVYLKKSKQRFYEAKKGKRGKYVLQPGDQGAEVERLQRILKAEGLYQGPVDGRYSVELERAVMELQRRNNLNVDGIAGPRTKKALGIY